MITTSTNIYTSITESPEFSYLVAIVIILLIGIGYYLYDKYILSKMK